jgi:hypothetical protein
MKVLKVGIDLKTWTDQITCFSCHSDLEIMASDIKYQLISGSYRNDDTTEFSVDCPVCNRKVVLDKKDTPQIVMTNAREKNRR